MPALVEMAARFHEAKQDRYSFEPDDCKHFLAGLIAAPNAAVFIAPQGFICGAWMGAPTNAGHRTAYEVLWWSEGRDGLRLRREFENWAREQGCVEVNFSHPVAETTVNRLLLRAGYEPETAALRKAI